MINNYYLQHLEQLYTHRKIKLKSIFYLLPYKEKWMANNLMKRYLTSLGTKEIQIKAPKR